jgi:hypothetical protein
MPDKSRIIQGATCKSSFHATVRADLDCFWNTLWGGGGEGDKRTSHPTERESKRDKRAKSHSSMTSFLLPMHLLQLLLLSDIGKRNAIRAESNSANYTRSGLLNVVVRRSNVSLWSPRSASRKTAFAESDILNYMHRPLSNVGGCVRAWQRIEKQKITAPQIVFP